MRALPVYWYIEHEHHDHPFIFLMILALALAYPFHFMVSSFAYVLRCGKTSVMGHAGDLQIRQLTSLQAYCQTICVVLSPLHTHQQTMRSEPP